MMTEKGNSGSEQPSLVVSSPNSRIEILRTIQSPLGFFTLVVLITEPLLGYIATKSSGHDFTMFLGGMLVLLFSLVLIVARATFKNPYALTNTRESSEMNKLNLTYKDKKYDVFVSSPMAATKSNKEYQKERQDVLQVIECLKKDCEFKSIFYAGNDISSKAHFDSEEDSVKDDLQAITSSKYFILIYPRKVISSVLFEAGCALALGKYSIYFVKNRQDLPFLMKNAEKAFKTVKIYSYNSIENIKDFLSNNKHELFKKTE